MLIEKVIEIAKKNPNHIPYTDVRVSYSEKGVKVNLVLGSISSPKQKKPFPTLKLALLDALVEAEKTNLWRAENAKKSINDAIANPTSKTDVNSYIERQKAYWLAYANNTTFFHEAIATIKMI